MAAFQFDDLARERQTESRTLIMTRRAGIDLLEFPEEPWQVLRLDADARVPHGQLEAILVVPVGGDARHLAAVIGEFESRWTAGCRGPA